MSSIDTLLTKLSAIQPIGAPTPAKPSAPGAPQRQTQFGDLLQQEVREHSPIKFSAHAQNRLQHRQISLTDPQVARLEKSVSSAAEKGAESSLVLLDNLALIVSVRNRTVVTALDQAQTSSHVFTQIDSAVIA
ncbi:MAG: flagellar protein [bacterium]|nr:flagellar protein [bacterium]